MRDPSLRDFHLRWARITPPQRPPPVVAEAMRGLLAACDGALLQLGVTPEIARVGSRGVALDFDAAMVRLAWRESATHHALVADWREMPLAAGAMAGALGDGSLTMLRFPEDYLRVLAELRRVLRPGSRAVFRCFAPLDPGETPARVRDAAMAGMVGNFGAFRARFNMAVAAGHPGATVTSAAIHDAFRALFPSRDALAEAAGWSRAEVDMIDAYARSAALHSYPARDALLAAVPADMAARFVDLGGYAGAERCPLLVLDFS